MNCFDDVVSAYRSSSMNLALADKILRMTLLACCYDGYASPCIRILYLYCNSKMDCWQDIAHQNGHRLRTIRIYIQLQLMSVVSREFRKLLVQEMGDSSRQGHSPSSLWNACICNGPRHQKNGNHGEGRLLQRR